MHARAEVGRIVASGPAGEAVPLTSALLDGADSDDALIAIAAGPLEELLTERWDEVIDQIEALAREGGRIRRALTSVGLPHR